MAELLARVHWKRVNQPCQDSKKIIGIESALIVLRFYNSFKLNHSNAYCVDLMLHTDPSAKN